VLPKHTLSEIGYRVEIWIPLKLKNLDSINSELSAQKRIIFTSRGTELPEQISQVNIKSVTNILILDRPLIGGPGE
jgi:hypothetical protein